MQTQQLASRWKRLVGALIDAIVLLVPIFLVMNVTGLWSFLINGGKLTDVQQFSGRFIGASLYLVINGYLLATQGQSVGKWLLGTQIVKFDGSKAPFFTLVIRYLVSHMLAVLPLGKLIVSGGLLCIFGPERRCLHDYVMGTKVVDK